MPISSRYRKHRWHTDARFDKWHPLRTLARLRGYPPDLTKAVLAGKIKHADAVRELRMERDQAQRSPEPETADAPEQGRELAPEPPAVPETAAPPAPEPESVRDPDSAPEPELACRKCGTPLERGKLGRPPTMCLPCRRRGQYQRRKERRPPTDAERAYRNLRNCAAYARERASWWAAERDRLERETAEAEAGLADQPF